MLYLLLIICIAILGLMLLNTQQKNKKLMEEQEMQLVQCAKCNTYITKSEAYIKNGICHCHDCLQR